MDALRPQHHSSFWFADPQPKLKDVIFATCKEDTALQQEERVLTASGHLDNRAAETRPVKLRRKFDLLRQRLGEAVAKAKATARVDPPAERFASLTDGDRMYRSSGHAAHYNVREGADTRGAPAYSFITEPKLSRDVGGRVRHSASSTRALGLSPARSRREDGATCPSVFLPHAKRAPVSSIANE